MLSVIAEEPDRERGHLFDLGAGRAHIVRGTASEHIAVDTDNAVVRFDVVEGTASAGPVGLRFIVADDERLKAQITSIRAFRALAPPRPYPHLARRLIALQARDARDSGASLRKIGDLLIGSGGWPGDGEHRKSSIRRWIALGDRMVSEGPRAILAST